MADSKTRALSRVPLFSQLSRSELEFVASCADEVSAKAGQALIKRIPQRRLGELRELEGPLLLLASEAGSYMTGSVIVADGGHVVSTL